MAMEVKTIAFDHSPLVDRIVALSVYVETENEQIMQMLCEAKMHEGFTPSTLIKGITAGLGARVSDGTMTADSMDTTIQRWTKLAQAPVDKLTAAILKRGAKLRPVYTELCATHKTSNRGRPAGGTNKKSAASTAPKGDAAPQDMRMVETLLPILNGAVAQATVLMLIGGKPISSATAQKIKDLIGQAIKDLTDEQEKARAALHAASK